MTFEEKIGFSVVRQRIRELCSTEYARARTDNEVFSTDAAVILNRLSTADEMRLIMMFESRFPQGPFTDCTRFLPRLKVKSSSISLESLRELALMLQSLRAVVVFLQRAESEKYPSLKALAEGVQYFPDVESRIESILDKNGDVREDASATLAQICSSLRRAQKSIGGKMQSILEKAKREGIAEEDANISVREGKLLIPVTSYNKRGLPGIVQDASASGRTFFIEPIEVVELNNRVRELEFEREREILKILSQFTDFLRPHLEELVEGAKFIGEIDFIIAKAECARRMGAGRPILSQEGTLRIIKGRHPVMESALTREGREIVPIDLEINATRRILIISGPNAGGKSACLKMIGILQYMFQWGMPTPCSEVSEFPVFEQFRIDIGDDQSLENDLSTYSSHLQNMKEILQNADERTLVLIDEFGSGTEPAAGGAIAETILEELERKGVYGVITTHYTNLKVYAEKSEGAINGAMQFDAAHIQPLYKLEMGEPGNSFAFDLARKTGLPEQIVKRAEERAGDEFINLEKQLRRISRNRRKLEEKLAHIKVTDKNLESLEERYTKELSQIKEQRRKIISEATEEARQIISQANKKIESTIKSIKESAAEKAKTKEAREKLKEFTQQLDSDPSDDIDKKLEEKMIKLSKRKKKQQERKGQKGSAIPVASVNIEEHVPALKIGSKVRVEGSNLYGEVIKIGKKQVSVSVGEAVSKVPIERVTIVDQKEFDASKGNDYTTKRSLINVDSEITRRKREFKMELDLHGYHLEAALKAVEEYIDNALLASVDSVRINHGKGTGTLKKEIRKYLETVPGVKSATDEDVRYGGDGITVVRFK